jgi:quercetin dioxygenase-like cupin family protein
VSSDGRFDQLEPESPFPGIVRRALTTDEATVTEYRFEPGATFPQHHHPQEQITLVLSGEVRMTIAGTTRELSSGGWSVVPGGIAHGITAGATGATFLALLVPRRDPADPYTTTTPEPPAR